MRRVVTKRVVAHYIYHMVTLLEMGTDAARVGASSMAWHEARSVLGLTGF
jgi:hypothetical protein